MGLVLADIFFVYAKYKITRIFFFFFLAGLKLSNQDNLKKMLTSCTSGAGIMNNATRLPHHDFRDK